MAMECFLTRMEKNMTETLLTIKEKDKGHLRGVMEDSTTEDGKMVVNTALELTKIYLERYIRENGKMVAEFAG